MPTKGHGVLDEIFRPSARPAGQIERAAAGCRYLQAVVAVERQPVIRATVYLSGIAGTSRSTDLQALSTAPLLPRV